MAEHVTAAAPAPKATRIVGHTVVVLGWIVVGGMFVAAALADPFSSHTHTLTEQRWFRGGSGDGVEPSSRAALRSRVGTRSDVATLPLLVKQIPECGVSSSTALGREATLGDRDGPDLSLQCTQFADEFSRARTGSVGCNLHIHRGGDEFVERSPGLLLETANFLFRICIVNCRPAHR